MDDLYKRIDALCPQKGITITGMCKESGANRASLTDLKKGRKQGLSAETLAKIATYFKVSVDFLLGVETKKAPTSESGREIDDRKMKDEIADENPPPFLGADLLFCDAFIVVH